MKNIFVLYTGGTIGMVQSAAGLRPDAAIAQTALSPFSGSLKARWHICNPLIDSSALTPQNWADWLAVLHAELPRHDGALILHGTDTLAHTAALFALAADTQGKPVIITGAQKPMGAENSDAPRNLADAAAALLRRDIHEILIAFGGSLFPAVGSSKTSTETDNGFANPHFGTWQPENPAPPLSGNLKRRFDPNIRVLPILLSPSNMLTDAAALLNRTDADAAILLSYGHGNAPADAALLSAIARFTAGGRPLLNISQVPQGRAAAVYAQGSALRQSGAISGGRCNLETAVPLLMLAAANRWTHQDIEAELKRLRLV